MCWYQLTGCTAQSASDDSHAGVVQAAWMPIRYLRCVSHACTLPSMPVLLQLNTELLLSQRWAVFPQAVRLGLGFGLTE
jgi:hypothetical protein